jgi:hypothetical protein
MAEEKKKDEGRKVNPWIPVAVVIAIVALVGIMALMSNNSSTPSTANVDQAASGTTQSGATGSSTADVDVTWITKDTTPADIVSRTGIPAKMFQQLYSITDADMAKPLGSLGGKIADVAGVQDFVAQFVGGGGMGGSTGGSTSGAPSGMGGTTTP